MLRVMMLIGSLSACVGDPVSDSHADSEPAAADMEANVETHEEADVMKDGVVDRLDLEVVGHHLGKEAPEPGGICIQNVDVNNDGKINVSDLVLIGRAQGQTAGDADVMNDGVVDRLDLEVVGHYLGKEAPEPGDICLQNIDINNDEQINVSDLVAVARHVSK